MKNLVCSLAFLCGDLHGLFKLNRLIVVTSLHVFNTFGTSEIRLQVKWGFGYIHFLLLCALTDIDDAKLKIEKLKTDFGYILVIVFIILCCMFIKSNFSFGRIYSLFKNNVYTVLQLIIILSFVAQLNL